MHCMCCIHLLSLERPFVTTSFQLNCLHASVICGPKWPTTCHLHYQKKAEYLASLKMALSQAFQHIYYVDPFWNMRAHGALMHKQTETQYVLVSNTVWSLNLCILDMFIPTSGKHLPNILQEIMDHNHQRHNWEQGWGQSVPTSSSGNNTEFRCHPTDRQHMQRPPSPRLLQLRTRGQSQHHDSFHCSTSECLINAFTMVTTPAWLLTHPTAPGMHHTLLQLRQWVSYVITMGMQTGENYMQNISPI